MKTRQPLILKDEGAGDWAVWTPVTFIGSSGDSFTVPAGFITDLASVPRLLQIFIPKIGSHNSAAVLHDALWRASKAYYAGDLSIEGDQLKFPYRGGTLVLDAGMLVDPVDVDGLFRRAMKEIGVWFPRRWAMWAGVRAAAILDGRVGAMRLHHWLQLLASAGSAGLFFLAPVVAALRLVL